MNVNEIFLSIQGEGLLTGFPTVFVRFSGCNLRCSYCDTAYAYDEGVEMEPNRVVEEIKIHQYKRVCLTGGEPLLQTDINILLDLLKGYRVSIETNGSVLIDKVKRGESQTFALDMKCPSSGFSEKMNYDNFKYLNDRDEIKFIVGSREDYDWAKDVIVKYYQKGSITFSPVFEGIRYSEIVEWILNDKLDVRFQLQLHKFIWSPEARGV